jgi:signal transduction histidine kinase
MRNDVICLPMKRSKKIPPLVKEELTSRIEIQERSLQAYSKEIFENIGQVLSLVKLQLLSFQPSNNNDTDNILDSGKLLGKAIADLRNLTKQLSPDEIIKKGFAHAIDCELKRLGEAGFCRSEFSVKENFISLHEVKELVVFCILQQLTYPVIDMYYPGFIDITIHYRKDSIEIEVAREFKGEPLILDIEGIAKLKQRLDSIDGSIKYKDQNWNILQIIINT